jgi:hypothetical protein
MIKNERTIERMRKLEARFWRILAMVKISKGRWHWLREGRKQMI